MEADKDKIKNWFLTKYITANGKVLQGLKNRRLKEWELYNK
jgi:GH24 family phage-related lysozyme (muramidase)